MPIEIRMPRPAPDIDEADLIAWLVEPGAEIALGDPILEIETEKSTLEIESPCAGQLQEILVPPGSLSVPVGTLLGLIEPSETDTERPADPAATTLTPVSPPTTPTTPTTPTPVTPVAPPTSATQATPPAPPPPATEPAPPSQETRGSGEPTPPSTALARRLAKRAGIALGSIQGSGFHGRVTREDVERSPLSPNAPAGTFSPSLRLEADCQVDALMEILAHLEQDPGGSAIPLEVALLRATALGIRETPEIRRKPVGTGDATDPAPVDIALSTHPAAEESRGLRGVDRKGFAALSAEWTAPGSAEQADMHPENSPPEFALAHMGVEGVDRYWPPVEPGTLVSVGTALPRPQPVLRGEAVGAGYVLSLTLCADARAIDPPGAARLLARIRRLIEQPLEMTL